MIVNLWIFTYNNYNSFCDKQARRKSLKAWGGEFDGGSD
jgi:hypothetical protein